MRIRVGVDIVGVDRLRRLLAEHVDALDTLFTHREQSYCLGKRRRYEHLAARFAAKEAALKVIATGDQGISFRDIEVLGQRARNPRLALHGRAAQLAADAGLTGLSLSVTHDDILAAAFVVAQCR